MFRTINTARATSHGHGIILYGHLYLSNDKTTYDDETRDLVNRIEIVDSLFKETQNYKERLNIWYDAGIKISGVWIGDTSRIVETANSLSYKGQPKPEPDFFISIDPYNHSQILDFNLKNVQSYFDKTGDFATYKSEYLEHMTKHADSVLYERKLALDINSAENELPYYEAVGMYGISTRKWHDSFTYKSDTLNKKDYEIWTLDEQLSNVPVLNSTGSISPPYFLYVLDTPNDVIRAANAYIVHLKLPFLRKLKEEYDEKIIASVEKDAPATSSESVPTSSATELNIKLKWNGAADTLYDVFRQLKNHHLPKGESLIDDSYDQIARFIQQTFVGFDKVATSTIRGKLTKNERPKKTHNRADLDLPQSD